MKALLLLLSFTFQGFFDLAFTDADGNNVPLHNYAGKKVLLVNIATGSRYIDQLGALTQLQASYGDSLAVIAFPSNSFGHESRTDAEIKGFCQLRGANFTIAGTSTVSGPGRCAVYAWLKDSTQNGVASFEPAGDFQKYLIGPDGRIIGIFAPVVNPMDSVIIEAITNQ